MSQDLNEVRDWGRHISGEKLSRQKGYYEQRLCGGRMPDLFKTEKKPVSGPVGKMTG